MKSSADRVFEGIARMYQEQGFPGAFAFAPSPGEDVAFNELQARGLIKGFTMDSWTLTDFGRMAILRSIKPSPEAERAFDGIAKLYKESGYSAAFAFHPSEGEHAAFSELNARGFIKGFTMDSWALTDLGRDTILRSIKPSTEAERVFAKIARLYREHGYPAAFMFSPGDGEQPAYNELLARSLIQGFTMESWTLTDTGRDAALRLSRG